MTTLAFAGGDAEGFDPLPRILSEMVAELTVFGTCVQNHSQSRAGEDQQRLQVSAYLGRRQLPFSIVFAVAEQHSGLHFTGARLPYRHNSATWPVGREMAGYTDEGPVTPMQWVSAGLSNWTMVANGSDTGSSEFHRVLRSALWIYQRNDLVAALDYIVDLIDGGHIANPAAAARAGALLIRASSCTAGQNEAISLIAGGTPPAQRDEWLVFPPNWDIEKARTLTGDGRRAAENLIARGWRSIHRTRDAAGSDDWLSSILALGDTLLFIDGTLKLSLATISPAVRAVLSQFEEVRCDVAVAVTCMELGQEVGGGVNGFAGYQRDLRDGLRKVSSSDLRFRQERLLLPVPVLESGCPGNWGPPGRRFALPWTLGHTFLDNPAIVDPDRPVPAGFGAGKREREVGDLLDAMVAGFVGSPDPTRSAAEARHFLETYPWNADAHHLLALARYVDNDLPGACEQIECALGLAPQDPAHWNALRAICAAMGRGPAVTLIDQIRIPLRTMAAKRKPGPVAAANLEAFWSRP